MDKRENSGQKEVVVIADYDFSCSLTDSLRNHSFFDWQMVALNSHSLGQTIETSEAECKLNKQACYSELVDAYVPSQC